MKKHILTLSVIFIILSSVWIIEGNAEIYGNCVYTVTDGEAAIITIANTSATSVSIPSTINGYPVTSIGDKAFQGNIKIESIEVPEGVTSIGEYAFDNCLSLKNIKLPHSLTSIGKYAFNSCTSIEEICIPYSVSSIGTYAFSDCTKLKGISIPSSLKSIDTGVFYNCESLEYINIPTTLTTVGWNAFYYQYYNQRALEINYYGSEAEFYGIDIESGNDCFNVTGWRNYEVDNGIEGIFTYIIENDMATVIDCETPVLTVAVPHTLGGCLVVGIDDIDRSIGENNTLIGVELPDTIKKIGEQAFKSCIHLKNIILPKSVLEIGWEAFANCYALVNVTISENLTKIGIAAFANCKSLSEIDIPLGIETIESSTFENCYSLKTVTLPEGMTNIYYDAFANCTQIDIVNFKGTQEQWNSIKIEEGNDYLVNATVNCLEINVTGITLNSNELSLYIDDTFTLTATITPTNATNKDVKWESSNGNVAKVSDGVVTAIAAGVATITVTTVDGKYKDSCEVTIAPRIVNVSGIALDKGSISLNIGDNETLIATVFPSDATTQTVTWKSSNTSVAIVSDGIVTARSVGTATITATTVDGSYTDTCKVEVSACGICGTNLIWKLSADGVLTISGTGDMYDYKQGSMPPWYSHHTLIKNVVVSEGVTSIGNYAFCSLDDINNITQVLIADSVIKIGEWAFADCVLLKEINIPDSVVDLGKNAIRGCTNLEKVIIGAGVSFIDDGMFWCDSKAMRGSYKLKTITVSENNQYYCSIDGNLYNKAGTVLKKYAYGKSETKFEVPEGVAVIGYAACCDSDNLEEVILADTVEKIEESGFDRCPNLKTIQMGKKLQLIDLYAFDYCTKLNTVYYNGTKKAWNEISIDETNEYLLNAIVYYAEEDVTVIDLSADNISLYGITEDCRMIVASYKDSLLVDIKVIIVSADTDILISETGLNTNGADTIKCMLWKNGESILPLCEKAEKII